MSLDLQGVTLKDEGVEGLAQGLEHNDKLNCLTLSRCSIGELNPSEAKSAACREHRGVIHLFRWLRAEKRLNTLRLDHNCLSVELLVSLTEVLKDNTSLTRLFLAGNVLEFSPESCNAVSGLISASQSMEVLTLPDVSADLTLT